VPEFAYNFNGLGAPDTATVREQIREKIKSIAPSIDDKKMQGAFLILHELDEALGEHFYQESLNPPNKL